MPRCWLQRQVQVQTSFLQEGDDFPTEPQLGGRVDTGRTDGALSSGRGDVAATELAPLTPRLGTAARRGPLLAPGHRQTRPQPFPAARPSVSDMTMTALESSPQPSSPPAPRPAIPRPA